MSGKFACLFSAYLWQKNSSPPAPSRRLPEFVIRSWAWIRVLKVKAGQILRTPFWMVSLWSVLWGLPALSLHYALASSLLEVASAGRFYLSYPRKYFGALPNNAHPLQLAEGRCENKWVWPEAQAVSPGSCSLARTYLLCWDVLELCRWFFTWASRRLWELGCCCSSHFSGNSEARKVVWKSDTMRAVW